MLKPRDYQREALSAIKTAREYGREKALVVMASGLGKTLTAGFDILDFFEQKPDAKVLFLCHESTILAQAKRKFQELFGEGYSYALYDGLNPLKRATDFLFTTFQMMAGHRKEFTATAFDYVVVDESHHAAAKTYFPTIRYFRPQFMLALTATPDRADGEDIREIFGEAVFELGLFEAWDRGLLAPVNYRLVLDELAELDKYFDKELGKVSLKELNRTLFAPKRDEEIIRLIRKYSKDREDPTTFIFCRSVAHAEKIAELYGEEAAVVHSRQNPAVNEEILKKFQLGEIRTIVSVMMLNEGIDIPRADVIVFLRDTSSETVFLQQLGRGLRLAPGKDDVLVLDFVNNIQRIEYVLDIAERAIIARKPRASGSSSGTVRPKREVFTLNIATPKFRERMADVKGLVGRVGFRHYSDEELIRLLQKKYERDGVVPTMNSINKDPLMPSATRYAVRFGGLSKALEKAGLTPFQPGYSDDVVIGSLRRAYDILGHSPTSKEFRNLHIPDAPSYSYYKKHFESWSDAIAAAGLPKAMRPPRYTKERLIKFLQDMAQELGRFPKVDDIPDFPGFPSSNTFTNAFGSWSEAMRAAGFDRRDLIEPRHEAIRKEVTEKVQAVVKELGRVPTQNEFVKLTDISYNGKIYRYCGGWFNVLREAGFEPDEKSLRRWK